MNRLGHFLAVRQADILRESFRAVPCIFTCQIRCKRGYAAITLPIPELIQSITETTATPLVPEISLQLITQNCKLWTSRPEACPFSDPYWAFLWPGGQALCRYLFDNPEICANKSVLDLGSGGGASVITALKCDAKLIIANDIDPIAIEAIKVNFGQNFESDETQQAEAKLMLSRDDIFPATSSKDDLCLEGYFEMMKKLKLQPSNSAFDVILVGDLFYDDEIASRLMALLKALRELSPETFIYIGDPGRPAFLEQLSRMHIKPIAQYELPSFSVDENYGFSTASVYQFS